MKKINVQGTEISVMAVNAEDYISITLRIIMANLP